MRTPRSALALLLLLCLGVSLAVPAEPKRLLKQEGCDCRGGSRTAPTRRMRRGVRQPTDGVVANRKEERARRPRHDNAEWVTAGGWS